MEIRELNEGDLDSLIKLYEQLDGSNGDFTIEAARAIWKSEIEGNKNIKYFGAVEGGKVISTCFCLIIPNLKDHRGQGLGKKIMERAIAFARERDCYKVILESASFRKEAHQFYKNLGFDGDSKKAFIMKLKKY